MGKDKFKTLLVVSLGVSGDISTVIVESETLADANLVAHAANAKHYIVVVPLNYKLTAKKK